MAGAKRITVLCAAKKRADVDHFWWECQALHNGSDSRLASLRRTRATGRYERCLWTTGVALTEHSAARPTDDMLGQDTVTGEVQHPPGARVYTDGSCKSAGARRYAGWGIYCEECPALTTAAPLYGGYQTASKGEVRAIVEVAERATTGLHIVTDSKYAMDMAMEIKTGGKIPEGTHKTTLDEVQRTCPQSSHDHQDKVTS